MAAGPAAGLALVDRLVSLPAMQGYCYLPSVRGHLLEQLGRTDEARREFERAASLTGTATSSVYYWGGRAAHRALKPPLRGVNAPLRLT
jgi:predicted RNA polymerase sigma factor